MLKDKIILVTGGTGSFGNAVIHKLIEQNVSEIRIFSRDEKKQDDMRKKYNNPKLKFYIGDVRDYNSIESAMCGVDYVFSAAALKQVPSCEFFPMEAVKTNILGTENVLNCAIKNKVKRVVVLSTDKAVYPINAMGMSKALMEKISLAKSRESRDTDICCTRYGNIIASRGSVIPLFYNQIVSGKPITVTDPNMTRFMMSLNDAVELVLFALYEGKNGMLYVQKAPSSTIANLVEAMKIFFNADNEINIIGTRHGEKQHETLLTREEFTYAVDLGKYYSIPLDKRDLNYDKMNDIGNINVTDIIDYTSQNTNRLNLEQMISLINENKDLIINN